MYPAWKRVKETDGVDDMAEETRSISCIPEKPGLLMVK
jgi:hypothetical protein